MTNSDYYVGLDIGTTSIKVIISEYTNKQFNIIGSGNVASSGVKRGVIVDIDQVVDVIKQAVKQAREKADAPINDVIVGVPANKLDIEQCMGMITIASEDSKDREITNADVQAVTQAAMIKNIPPEREIIDIVPNEFSVDDFNEISDPRGMIGVQQLRMSGVMYTGPKTLIHNIKTSVLRAGLSIREMVVAPVAIARVALSEGEKDFGTVVIDIGGGQTTASVIHDHKLKYTYVDQEGGDFITRDISMVLNTTLEEADSLKRSYGYAMAEMASSGEEFPVKKVGKKDTDLVTEEYLSEIIEARLRQIFEKIFDNLQKIKAFSLPGGVVLTGGVASLPGISDLAEEIFNVPSRIYAPDEMGLRIPAFTQGIGLVSHVYAQSEIEFVVRHTLDGQLPLEEEEQYYDDEDEKEVHKENKKRYLTRITSYLRGFFKENQD